MPDYADGRQHLAKRVADLRTEGAVGVDGQSAITQELHQDRVFLDQAAHHAGAVGREQLPFLNELLTARWLFKIANHLVEFFEIEIQKFQARVERLGAGQFEFPQVFVLDVLQEAWHRFARMEVLPSEGCGGMAHVIERFLRQLYGVLGGHVMVPRDDLPCAFQYAAHGCRPVDQVQKIYLLAAKRERLVAVAHRAVFRAAAELLPGRPSGTEAVRAGGVVDDYGLLWFRLGHIYRVYTAYLARFNASIAGSFSPARNSRKAPPPVEMKENFLSSLCFFKKATVSPPPVSENARRVAAMALATARFPCSNFFLSMSPIGPLQIKVRADAMRCAKILEVFGPISSILPLSILQSTGKITLRCLSVLFSLATSFLSLSTSELPTSTPFSASKVLAEPPPTSTALALLLNCSMTPSLSCALAPPTMRTRGFWGRRSTPERYAISFSISNPA